MSRWVRPPFRPGSPDASRAGRPGFTLAEILVAIGVLLVAFLGVITVYMVGHGDISEGGHDTIAAMAAQSLVEDLRNLPRNPQLPANLLAMNGVDTANPLSCPPNPARLHALCSSWVTQFNQQLPRGRATVQVVPSVPVPGGATFSQITVNVSWDEPTRGGRRLVVVSGRGG